MINNYNAIGWWWWWWCYYSSCQVLGFPFALAATTANRGRLIAFDMRFWEISHDFRARFFRQAWLLALPLYPFSFWAHQHIYSYRASHTHHNQHSARWLFSRLTATAGKGLGVDRSNALNTYTHAHTLTRARLGQRLGCLSVVWDLCDS